jgi:hypothetical protein
MELGRIYSYITWEKDEEASYGRNSSGRSTSSQNIYEDVMVGAFIGEHGDYNMFVGRVPDKYSDMYEVLYVEKDSEFVDTEAYSGIPHLYELIRFVNNGKFEHPERNRMQTTYKMVPEADILRYSKQFATNLNAHIKNVTAKRRFKKKIGNWMTALPPLEEVGFSGGPFYKRAAASFKNAAGRGGKRNKRKTRKA